MGEIIAIDGPAGAGKSSTALEVARKLGYIYIDTGAMYRAVTLAAINNDVEIEDEKQIVDLASSLNIKFKKQDGEYLTYMDSRDVSNEIRTSRVGELVSPFSAIPGVREVLVDKQRSMAKDDNVVMEGRDIGTNVFPEADYKFYITADVRTRAKRRLKDYKENDQEIALEQVIEELKERDRIDSSRDVAPLKKPKDAFEVDTSNLDFKEQVNIIVNKVRDK